MPQRAVFLRYSHCTIWALWQKVTKGVQVGTHIVLKRAGVLRLGLCGRRQSEDQNKYSHSGAVVFNKVINQ